MFGAAAALAAGLLMSATALAQPTHPVTFGASLAQAPNVNFDCKLEPYVLTPLMGNWPSCTWGNPLFNISDASAGGLDVPGTGTVYKVKLRVGASTGPMQLVVLRTLFDSQDLTKNQCCVLVARSSVFTPVRNGITTSLVTLPVKEEASPDVPTDYLDQIGLSILEDGVTIPVINETSLPVQDRPADEFVGPAMSQLGQSTNGPAGDPDGYILDMQATWYPPGQSPAAVTLPAQPVTVSAGSAHVGIDCALAPCAGTVHLQSGPGASADQASAAKLTTYATGNFNLAAGKKGSFPAKLTSAGKALASKHKSIKVYVVATLTNLHPAKTVTRSVTVKF
jgi:hypothetical protein